MATSNDEPAFSVDFSSGQAVSLDALRARGVAVMPDNGHAWTISTVFALDDPEQALDQMTLGAANFIGVSDIRCLLCHEPYRSVNRFHKCPQTPSGG